jgi:uncharacterized membrane protein
MLADGQVLHMHVGSTAPLFLAILAVHVPAGLTAVATGAATAVYRKGSRRHVRLGRTYYGAITVVFVTATLLAALRWREDYPVFLLGALAFTAATLGFRHRRRHRPGDDGHIVGMGVSYAALLTAFFIDNGPHLPLFDRLPAVAFWLLPGAIAAPVILRAMYRARTRRRRDTAALGEAERLVSPPPRRRSGRLGPEAAPARR